MKASPVLDLNGVSGKGKPNRFCWQGEAPTSPDQILMALKKGELRPGRSVAWELSPPQKIHFALAILWHSNCVMNNLRRWLWIVTLGWVGSIVAANAAHTKATLLISQEQVRPGETILVGVRLQMDPGWHTYWKNAGDSGDATKIEWQLPPGVSAGEISWPTPEKLEAEGFWTYIYHREAVFLIPVTIASTAGLGTQEWRAKVSWLECEKICVPGSTTVTGTIQIGSNSKPSTHAATLNEWKAMLPQTRPGTEIRAFWEKPASGPRRPVLIDWTKISGAKEGDFFPYASDKFSVTGATEVVSVNTAHHRIRKWIEKTEGDWPTTLAGLLVDKDVSGRVLSAQPANIPIESSDASVPVGRPQNSRPLLAWLGLAFLGGLILNVMPCVLPVIALKIFGFVQQANEQPGQVRRLGLIYALGVLVSFGILAGVVIGVKTVGQAASWGMQFQNAQFVVGMTVLVTLVALNLLGVFEVTLSGGALDAAGGLAAKEGAAGAFFNGVLATALATPCTAPFLGAALGFAFTQSAAVILLVFLTVGLGLAFPYVVLCWQPGWLKFLPKPGAWMEKFKMAMAFPMLATAVWLYTLAVDALGDSSALGLGIFLVVVSLAAWIWGEFVQRGRSKRVLAMGIAAATLLVGYVLILEGQLNWRSPQVATNPSAIKTSLEGIDWQPWSLAAIETARSQSRPILVDFTAKWCLTCQVNAKTSLEIREVQKKLKEINALALLENSPKKNPVVVGELNRWGRAGVPLVLVYPKNPNLPPEVLPEILTPNIVLSALSKAAQ